MTEKSFEKLLLEITEKALASNTPIVLRGEVVRKQMTDRELLELAAKAAGIEVWFPRMSDGKGGVIEPCHRTLNAETVVWNPLVDDGDALRLAVKLSLDIGIFLHTAEPWVEVFGVDANGNVNADSVELCGNDSYAATRRAIVRAAAEIGRNDK